MAKTIMLVYDRGADQEAFKMEVDCVPRRGEVVVVAGVKRAVENVEWHITQNEPVEAHVYLWAQND
jgi:hypothetical protein